MEFFTVNTGKKTYRAQILRGYVVVETDILDPGGTRRTIDFPRVGFVLYGQPRHHKSVSRLVPELRRVARAAVKQYESLRCR